MEQNNLMIGILSKVRRKLVKFNEYSIWLRKNEKYKNNYELDENQRFSIIVIGNKKNRCIASIRKQKYKNFELTLSKTWNEKKIPLGEWILVVDSNTVLEENILFEIVQITQKQACDIIYFDEDNLDIVTGKRKRPFFKPNWSPDTLMSFMYFGQVFAVKRSIFTQIANEVDWDREDVIYDLALRATELTQKVAHVSKILIHNINRRRKYNDENVKEKALIRRGLSGYLQYIKEMNCNRVVYLPINNPLVSIIILSKNNYNMMEQCINSILKYTAYGNYEIILVDNGSEGQQYDKYNEFTIEKHIKYIYRKMEFNFSFMCNCGGKVSKGEFVLFLNDDIEIPSKDPLWLEKMLGQAQLSHVAMVGAKLLYPGTDIIQHDGIINLKEGPAHILCKAHDSKNYYYGRNRVEYNYSSVTAACMMVEKKIYTQLGGFNNELPVAYNDVDICLKAVEKGYYNVVRNDVCLYHHESVSRGLDIEQDKKNRLMKEKEKLYMSHTALCVNDPFYNINLSNQDGDFSLNIS